MKRIILHWTGGTHTVSSLDRQHYHFIVDGCGGIHAGIYPVKNNERLVGGRYAAHTLGCNTGSIGVSMAAMLNGTEVPYNPGKYPLTQVQWEATAKLVARLCRLHKILVTRRTVLSHAEVQPTLGIKQRGKWDITRLPWNANIYGAIPCGDVFRAAVLREL